MKILEVFYVTASATSRKETLYDSCMYSPFNSANIARGCLVRSSNDLEVGIVLWLLRYDPET